MEAERTRMGCFYNAINGAQVKADQEEEASKKHSSDSSPAPPPPTPNACFDCSICLDFAAEPVVTLCGHLYCWPCIYKWLQAESTSSQQCPVCKAPLSQNALVPLYGRGLTTKGAHQSLHIPNRPTVLRDQQHQSQNPPPGRRQQLVQPHHHYYSHYSNGGASPWGTGVFHSTAGVVLGGIAIAILPWVSRNNNNEAAAVPSPYHLLSYGNSPSQRRQEVMVERSLHQLWGFLFCCAVLCLLLF